MVENFEAVIGANIRDFQQELREVDAIIRETALGAEAMIGANTAQFNTQAAQVQSVINDIANSDPSVSVNANTAGFTAQTATVQAAVASIASASPTVNVNSNTAGALAGIATVQAAVAAVPNNVTVDVNANTNRFTAAIMSAMRFAENRVNEFQGSIARIAQTTRAFGELMQTTMRGASMALSPILVPLIASLGGLIGQLGPMVGVLAGSTFALGSAFATAGIGAAAFGAITVTNLKGIFTASEELQKLDEKLAKADTWKEQLEIKKEIARVQKTMNAEEVKGLDALNKLKSTWSEITGVLQAKTIQTFTTALGIMTGVLEKLKPMFLDVATVGKRLMDTLSRAIDAEPMQSFFNYLNATAAPMLVTITKAVGNFFQGFFSMMVAFGPLAAETAGSFLKMSESFAAWGASLSNNQQFQAFTAYVSENMPKIRSIFSDAIMGMINLFSAFAPSSAGMMSSLQDMMIRFREWSLTIAKNQGFQNFISYVQTNGPAVIGLIGNLTTFFVNLGIALAPMGAVLLGIVNNVISFTNSLMQSNPVLGAIIASVVVLTGALIALVPNIIAFGTLFAGIGAIFPAIGVAFTAMRLQFVTGIGMMIASLKTFVVSMATAAASAVASFARMIASAVTATAQFLTSVATMIGRWVLLGAQAMIHAAKVAAGWVLATGAAMATAVAKMIASAAVFVARWTLIGAQAMIHAAKVAAAWALSTGAALATATAKMVATAAVFAARWVFMGAQALAQAARMASAWLIAMGPVGWATGVVIALAAVIIANWDKIASWTQKTFSNISSWISTKWSDVKSSTSSKLSALVSTATTFFSNLVTAVKTKMAEAVVVVGSKVAEMPGKVLSYVGAMLSAGSNLVSGLINGIKNMGSAAVEAISGVVGGVINKAKSLLDINSPSRVFRAIGRFTGEGMALGVTDTKKKNEKVMAELGKVMGDVARANAQEIAKITAAVEKERALAKKDNIAKEREITRKAEEDIYQIKKIAESKKRNLTKSETLRIEQIRRDSAAKIRKEETSHVQELAKIQSKAAAEIKQRESEVQKERLSAIQTFVDNKAKLEGLSAIQEANIWRKAADSFKEGTQEKIDAQSKYRDKLNQINADIEAINSKYSQRMVDINNTLSTEIQRINDELGDKSKAAKDKLIEDEKRLNDAYSSALTDRYNTLKSFAGLFDKFESEPKETGTELLDNLQSQVDGFKSWESEISKLSTKGIDNGLLSELRDMGPKALPQLVALNSMTSEQLTQYSSLFREKSALARAEAEEQLRGMKADTQQQINELRAVTNAELTKLKNDARVRIVELRTAAKQELAILKVDWANDIAALTKSTEEQFKPLSQIGKDAVAGLIKGMQSMKGPLAKEAQAIADAVQKTIKSALQIHSPSRVMATLGQYTGQGLVNGLSSMISDVVKVSSQLAQAIVPDIATVQMTGVDIRSDIANMKQQIRQELEVSMDVNHSGGVGSVGAVSGGDTYYVTVDAKNVKEFNDIVRLFDKQKRQSQ